LATLENLIRKLRNSQDFYSLAVGQKNDNPIAKTHQIALRSIDAGHLVGPKIREIARTTGKSPKLLMVNAHGNSNEVAFGKKHWVHRLFFKNRHVYHESDVKAQDFADLAPDAQIHLPCCKTGKGLGGLEKSDKEAVKWLRLAANQGEPMAQFSLAILYSKGSGGLFAVPSR